MVQHVDGSTTIDVRDFNPSGGITSRTVTTKSADGRSSTAQQDLDGDGIYDRSTVHTSATMLMVPPRSGSNSIRSATEPATVQ
ncbi:hypothetical protein N8D56_25520 (plasmid) [Devosia sp. A8/3-2]|nr:hypothetical protein N8D56_25520 [Devosia sp. A8/3-2]